MAKWRFKPDKSWLVAQSFSYVTSAVNICISQSIYIYVAYILARHVHYILKTALLHSQLIINKSHKWCVLGKNASLQSLVSICLNTSSLLFPVFQAVLSHQFRAKPLNAPNGLTFSLKHGCILCMQNLDWDHGQWGDLKRFSLSQFKLRLPHCNNCSLIKRRVLIEAK